MEFTLTRSQARQFIVLWQGLSGPPAGVPTPRLWDWFISWDVYSLIPIDICGRNADLVLRRGSAVIGKVSWKRCCIRNGS